MISSPSSLAFVSSIFFDANYSPISYSRTPFLAVSSDFTTKTSNHSLVLFFIFFKKNLLLSPSFLLVECILFLRCIQFNQDRCVLRDNHDKMYQTESTKSATKSTASTSEIMKSSYQATNLLVNLFLGIYGIYTWTTSVPKISSIPALERIIGFNGFISFAALQIGYNLWALPMGLFVVHKRGGMIGHHMATLFDACIVYSDTTSPKRFRRWQILFRLYEVDCCVLQIKGWKETAF